MGKFLVVAVMFGLLWLEGCSSSSAAKAKVKGGSPPPDSTGVFVDACHFMIDSVTIEKGRILIHERGSPTEYAESDRAGDTVFYSGVFSFVRQAGPAGARYLFGYNHRGNRDNWADAMFLEVVPSRKMTPGRTYSQGNSATMLLCAEGAP